MIKNLWAARYVFAMLLSFALAIVGFLWAVREFPAYVGASILVLVLLVVITGLAVRRKQALENEKVNDAFQRSYAPLAIKPKLSESTSYGYPAFEVSFVSRSARDEAEACNTAFKLEIGAIFKGTGPWFRPFDAEMAVSFTYEGYLDELRAHYQAKWQKRTPERVNPERIV